MWEACAEKIKEMGGSVLMGERVTACDWNENEKVWTVKIAGADGKERQIQAEHVVSSAPMRELGMALTPKLSESATEAAGSLRYRDFVTVALIIKDREQFFRQLDLYSRSERQGRQSSKLQIVVAGNGSRPGDELLRSGIFLLQRRRLVVVFRRGTDRARQNRNRQNRAGKSRRRG
jgi:hypothetical protein